MRFPPAYISSVSPVENPSAFDGSANTARNSSAADFLRVILAPESVSSENGASAPLRRMKYSIPTFPI